MTIYVDMVFLENLIMNYIILYATAIISKSNKKFIRLIIASSVGGAYAILMYIAEINFLATLLLKLFLSIAIVYIAYKPKTTKALFKTMSIFYLVSFTFGGVSFMLLYFLKPNDIKIVNGVFIGMYPIKIVLLGGIIGFCFIVVSIKNIKGKFSSKDMFCNIKIFFNNRVVKVSAMVDSGNLLKEPITGMPVIIVEKDELDEIIPNKILDNLDGIISGEFDSIADLYNISFRVIPFSTIGKNNGLLLGFKPDYIQVIKEEDEKIVENVVIGIFQNKFTSNSKYTALIGIDILEGSVSENEFVRKIEI